MAGEAAVEIIVGILELIFETSIKFAIFLCVLIGCGIWAYSSYVTNNSIDTKVVVLRKLSESNIEYKILGTGDIITKSTDNEIFNNVKENDTITIPLYIN